jgi:IS605 OrfB family transposase
MQVVTYKYRLKDRSAKKALAIHAKAVNQVWNWCCAQQCDAENRYKAGAKPRKWLSGFSLAAQCKGAGKELGIHQQSIQSVCDQFAISRDKTKHAPRFRSSFGANRALGWLPFQKQSRQVGGNNITYLGKTYRWFGNKRRPLPETAKGGAFIEDSLGRWWVTFHVELSDAQAVIGPAIGIDLGLKTLATMSDGRKIDNIRPLRQLSDKLAVAQRAHNKQRTRAIHTKIANVRKDYLHKITTSLARSNALIAVGNVNSKKLVKTKMAKSVLDASWSNFRRMLAYKTPGFIEVDEKFTTQTCSGCGSIAGPKGYAGLNKREWDCPDCGESHDRDVNSAKVILFRALSVQRPDEESRRIAA